MFAHHSFAAEYDSSKPVTVTGKLTKMDWVNPHALIHIDVTGPDGQLVNWRCEAPPPNSLYRAGLTPNFFKPGDEVVVSGFLAKDGTPRIWITTVTTADARRRFAIR